MISRRNTLKSLLAGGTALLSGNLLGSLSFSSVAHAALDNALSIPPLLDGISRNGTRHYDLTMQQGTKDFWQGSKTPTLGINGDFLGPTLLLKKGENVQINVSNKIGEPTTLHWHGLHIPAIADGGPHQIIQNGDTWKPSFKVMNKAATFWYHSHMLHKTGEQVYRGLAGMMIVQEGESDKLGLPMTSGVDDIPLILQDRSFNRDGSFQYVRAMHDIMMGMQGNTILVNGTIEPRFHATTKKVRFRILNGANARFFTLGLDGDRPFHQIASDGGLLSEPVRLNEITLGPGERAEILVEISSGKPFNLVNKSPSNRQQSMGPGMMRGANNQRFDILSIIPAEKLTDSPIIPRKLTTIAKLRENDASKTRRFTLEMGMGPGMMRRGGRGQFLINGQSMKIDRIDETVKLGATEIWEIRNASPMAHPFHIHDIQFQILDRDGKPPEPSERGWKDTVRVHSNEVVRLIAKFEDFADPKHPYMYHCHILEHEDGGMMGQFVVV